MVCAGRPVPFRIGAPETLPGTISTTGHPLQSIACFVMAYYPSIPCMWDPPRELRQPRLLPSPPLRPCLGRIGGLPPIGITGYRTKPEGKPCFDRLRISIGRFHLSAAHATSSGTRKEFGQYGGARC